jgi:hypothetical protein
VHRMSLLREDLEARHGGVESPGLGLQGTEEPKGSGGPTNTLDRSVIRADTIGVEKRMKCWRCNERIGWTEWTAGDGYCEPCADWAWENFESWRYAK